MYPYDATLSVALGLHHLLYTQNKTNITPYDLHQTLLYNTRFYGLTGLVSYSTAFIDDEFDVGSRFTEILSDIVNYVPSINGTDAPHFNAVLQWHSELGFSPCGKTYHYEPNNPCHSFTFQTLDGSMPTDSPPPEIEIMPFQYRIILRTISSIGMSACVIIFGIISFFPSRRIVKMSQPSLGTLQKLGLILGFIRVLISSYEWTSVTCTTKLW